MIRAPKDVFELRRTHLALRVLEQAFNRLQEQLKREPHWPTAAAEWEARALLYRFLNEKERALKCEHNVDKAVEREYAARKARARRERSRGQKAPPTVTADHLQ